MKIKYGWEVKPFIVNRLKTTMYIPQLFTVHCVTQLDYPFQDPEQCEEFIRNEVLGMGFRHENS